LFNGQEQEGKTNYDDLVIGKGKYSGTPLSAEFLVFGAHGIERLPGILEENALMQFPDAPGEDRRDPVIW